jgi:hypothetical protein
MPMRPGGMPPEECHSLDRHLRMSPLLGNRVTPVPAQLRRGPRWFARLGRRETWLSTGNLRPPVSVTAATRTALQGLFCRPPGRCRLALLRRADEDGILSG